MGLGKFRGSKGRILTDAVSYIECVGVGSDRLFHEDTKCILGGANLGIESRTIVSR